jgi:hypothetical protein
MLFEVSMGDCLYLVSSSSSREYVADCVEALALPRGAVMHFRYMQKYVDESLLPLGNESAKLSEKLRNLPVVVVYLHQTQRGGEWKPEGQHLPLRCGVLLSAFTDGEVVHFYFSVGDYVKTLVDDKSPEELLESKIRFKTTKIDKDSGKSREVATYAHLGEDLALNAPEDQDSSAFQQFVLSTRQNEWRTRSLGSTPLDVTYDVVFYRIAGLYVERSGKLAVVKPKIKAIQGTRSFEYELRSGSTYHLKLMTQLPFRAPAQLPGQGAATIRLIFDSAIIIPAGPTSLRISSPYDLEYWSFVAETRASRHSVLNVVCQHDMAPSKEERKEFLRREFLCPEVVLPISVAPKTKVRR